MSGNIRQTASYRNGGRALARVRRLLSAACIGVAGVLVAAVIGQGTAPVSAQGFQWPWENDSPAPTPRQPVYRDAPRAAPQPTVRPGGDSAGNGWSARSSVCLQLEQRIVEESQRGGQARTQLPAIQNEMRQLQRDIRRGEDELDRRGCYEYFLFSKTLRRTRSCVNQAREVEDASRRLADLEAQRQSLESAGSQSYQDEIIRELARNNCGAAYQQEARRRDRGPLGFWNDGESDSGYGGNRYQALPFATYRTMCVRACDGYYFPVSFSTLPNHFQRDQDVCQQQCAAPAELFYYQNPGGSIDQMVSVVTNEPYTKLKTAFKYRKEYIAGCSCKQAEFVPQSPAGAPGEPSPAGAPPTEKRAELPQFSPKR